MPQKSVIRTMLALFAWLFLQNFNVVPEKQPETTTSYRLRKVVLDAGHGGKDPGCIGVSKTYEKDNTLAIVLALGAKIKAAYPDVEVIYTRDSDVFVELKERAAIANRNNADLFISVHCNAISKTSTEGAETYVMGLHTAAENLEVAKRENASIFLEDNGFDPNNHDTYIALSLRENVFLEHSADLAKNVQDLFRARLGRKDRGVKQAGYYVISFTNMPSILIELGFLTNAQEEDYLQSTEGKNALSKSIYDAFVEYKKSRKGEGAKSGSVEQKDETVPVVENPTVPVAENTSPVKKEGSDVMDAMIKEDIESQVIWRDGDKKGIWFKVQIYSSNKELKRNQPELKGLKKFDSYIYGGQFRYVVGNTQSFEEAKQNMKCMQQWGFTDAFIVAMQDGERMDLKEALKKKK